METLGKFTLFLIVNVGLAILAVIIIRLTP